jgi:molecular chaperone GrpE
VFETPDNGPVPEEESIRAHPAEPDASAQRIRAHPAEPDASAQRIRAHPAEPDASAQPVTSRDEAAEPSGEEDPANEKRILEEKEQAENSVAPSTAEDPLAQLQRERDEYLDLARRAQADFENYRKRAAREAAAAGERAKSGLVRELLPIVDNLERALASAGDSERHLAEGVQLVHAELLAVLERNGIEQFDPRGDRFDPGEHEALSMRAEDGAEPGVVLDVMEKGYRSNGNVLRPARVVVSG